MADEKVPNEKAPKSTKPESGRKFLNRADMLQSKDLPTEELEIPEWSGWVRVRTLTGKQRDWYEASLWQQKGKNRELNLANVRAKLVAVSCVDEAGALIFTEDDVRALGDKSAGALDRIFAVAQKLSRITDEDVENLSRPSGATSGDDSPFASPLHGAAPAQTSSTA